MTYVHSREDARPDPSNNLPIPNFDDVLLEALSMPDREYLGVDATKASPPTVTSYTRNFQRSCEKFPTAVVPGKSRITYHDIERGAAHPPLRWIHVTDPNSSVLDWLTRSFAVKKSDLISSLQPDKAAQSYRYGNYLVNTFAELSFAPSHPLKLVESRVLGILSDEFLITISTTESSSCQRVAQELQQQSAEYLKIDSSNHLFSRLLGSSLHVNEDVAFVLEESAERFSECAALDGPTPARRAQYAILKRSIIDAARALQNNPEVLHSLKEDRNLFGSEKPRAALERYQVIQASSESRLRQAEQFLTLSRDDWRLTQDEHRNGILFRLAILGGALSPTALATSLFSMNFPDGLPYSTTTMALGIGASVVMSTFLVGALMFKRAFPHHGHTVLKPSEQDIHNDVRP